METGFQIVPVVFIYVLSLSLSLLEYSVGSAVALTDQAA